MKSELIKEVLMVIASVVLIIGVLYFDGIIEVGMIAFSGLLAFVVCCMEVVDELCGYGE